MRWPHWRRRPGGSLPTSATTTGTTCTTTSTTGACDLRGSAGDDDILFTVEHERHRRSCLRQARLQIEKLFTSVGAIRQETVVHAGKDEISCGRQAAALIEAGGQSSPFLFLGDGIPRHQNIPATGRTDCRHTRRLRTAPATSSPTRCASCRRWTCRRCACRSATALTATTTSGCTRCDGRWIDARRRSPRACSSCGSSCGTASAASTAATVSGSHVHLATAGRSDLNRPGSKVGIGLIRVCSADRARNVDEARGRIVTTMAAIRGRRQDPA